MTVNDRNFNINVGRAALESNFDLTFRKLHRVKHVWQLLKKGSAA
jgi:hypothetical protein